MIVSNLPQGMSFSFMPLSTTALCWKKIIQGAIVVPMLAIRKKNRAAVRPPGKMRDDVPDGTKTVDTSGCTMNASGM